MKLRDANLQVHEKNFLLHILLHIIYFAFIFEEHITITSSKEALKVYEQNFFREYEQKIQ